MAVDRATGGYWLVGSDGGVFAFNAPFLGSTGEHPPEQASGRHDRHAERDRLLARGLRRRGVLLQRARSRARPGASQLNKPVVGMGLDRVDRRATGSWPPTAGCSPTTHPSSGSTGSIKLNKPVVAIAPVSDGSGYRLIASDGGVFSYNAPFFGSTGRHHAEQAGRRRVQQQLLRRLLDGGLRRWDLHLRSARGGHAVLRLGRLDLSSQTDCRRWAGLRPRPLAIADERVRWLAAPRCVPCRPW